MSVHTSTLLTYYNSSNANFQAWAGLIHTSLLSAGWVDTLDTGSTDPTSAAAPANNVYIFKVYRMSDALQATAPCFMKIRYGSSGTSLQASMGVQIGTATNGSGTLTNATTELLYNSGVTYASSATCYVSADTNRFSCYMFATMNVANGAFGFQVERSHDNTGADDTIDPYVWAGGMLGTITNGWRQQSIYPDNTQTVQDTNTGVNFPSAATSFRSKQFFAPWIPYIGCLGNPMVAGFAKASDLGISASTGLTTTLVLNFYGAAHTLICVNMSTSNGQCPCIRWE